MVTHSCNCPAVAAVLSCCCSPSVAVRKQKNHLDISSGLSHCPYQHKPLYHQALSLQDMAMRTSSLVVLSRLAASSPLETCLAPRGPDSASLVWSGLRKIWTGHLAAQQDSGTSTVFTGTADVKTDKSPDEVATDSNRCAQHCFLWYELLLWPGQSACDCAASASALLSLCQKCHPPLSLILVLIMAEALQQCASPTEPMCFDASCRRWVAEDDLGTRAEAAFDKAAEKTGRSPESQPGSGSEQQPEAAAEALANDEACHPADPYCTVGEAAPRSDDFHEEGDGTTPPSSGFPA